MQEKMHSEYLDILVSKLNTMGFVINLLIPAIILFAGYLIGESIRGSFSLDAQALTTIQWALIIVSIGEIVVAFFIKRRLFGNLENYFPEGSDLKARTSLIVKMMMIIHTLAATPAIYGLIFYLLGGKIEGFLLMIILNLIGYQLCRTRHSDVNKLRVMLQ
jgi:hypothetical protein